jgi:glycosyltransferase involved in cell wall biosynthesis
VPLVEAMALGVPVVARDAGAQATTLGGAGLVWDDPDAGLVAASIERLRGDAALRELLRERGTARVARAFTTDVLERGLAGVLERFA